MAHACLALSEITMATVSKGFQGHRLAVRWASLQIAVLVSRFIGVHTGGGVFVDGKVLCHDYFRGDQEDYGLGKARLVKPFYTTLESIQIQPLLRTD